MNKKIEHHYVELLELLVNNPHTNYQDLADSMSVSSRTIQRYIRELQLVLEELSIHLDLSVQPGVGLSFLEI